MIQYLKLRFQCWRVGICFYHRDTLRGPTRLCSTCLSQEDQRWEIQKHRAREAAYNYHNRKPKIHEI